MTKLNWQLSAVSCIRIRKPYLHDFCHTTHCIKTFWKYFCLHLIKECNKRWSNECCNNSLTSCNISLLFCVFLNFVAQSHCYHFLCWWKCFKCKYFSTFFWLFNLLIAFLNTYWILFFSFTLIEHFLQCNSLLSWFFLQCNVFDFLSKKVLTVM